MMASQLTCNLKDSETACKLLNIKGRILRGYGYGSSQPIAVLQAISDKVTASKTAISDFVNLIWSDSPGPSHGLPEFKRLEVSSGDNILDQFIGLYFRAHQGQGWPLFKWHYVIRQVQSGPKTITIIALPWWSMNVAKSILAWSASVINRSAMSSTKETKKAVRELRLSIAAIHKLNERESCKGTNMSHMISAAASLKIPTRLSISFGNHRVFRFGEGCSSKLYDSTISCQTSLLGALAAQSKHATSRILELHNIPIPQYDIATKVSDAVRIANDIGFPLVIKPEDTDGGRGVYAGISNLQQLQEFFPLALRYSPRIIVQRYVAGFDYRISVAHGEIIKIIKRLPGGVVGDGVSSIAQLAEKISSAKPMHYKTDKDLRRLIKIDKEAQLVLANLGLSADAVPAENQFIPLRTKANISTGGSQIIIKASELHPDNLLLALRCAASMRLDIAGIDLILKDHRQGWIETGGVVLEVNAKPEIGKFGDNNVYRRLLEVSMPSLGAIEYHLLVGCQQHINKKVAATLAHLSHKLKCDGRSHRHKVIMNNRVIAKDLKSGSRAARILLNEPCLKIGISYLSFTDIHQSGLPTNRISRCWLIDDPHISSASCERHVKEEVVEMIAKNCLQAPKQFKV